MDVIGIDLGTTFSSVAYIDSLGMAQVIPNSDASESTPSVIWFDGKVVYVGKKANDRKILPSSPIFEFVKRDIGKPRYINTIYDYEINGFYFGALGMSSIILRKLKKEAFNFLKKNGLLPSDADEKNTLIPAVITVPAYFGDLQRQETKNAGIAAGLNVISIINEPTAAALAYGHSLKSNKKILVFDLGGGTFDVTILEIYNGESSVLASDGADQLGGKDWDDIILEYIYSEYRKLTGLDIPEDMGWDIQQKALEAKYSLSEDEQTIVQICYNGNDVEIILNRNAPVNDLTHSEMDMDTDRPFYFDERSENLLTLCRAICIRLLEKSSISWGDIDDIVLAGGSCRMPMVPQMLERISGRKIPRNIPGFSFDTSIAKGAAIYGSRMGKVQDVTSKTIGIEVQYNGSPYIEFLILKNKQLPAYFEQSFKAKANAVLKVYEGDSHRPDECTLRGRLELGNPEGEVIVKMNISVDGVLSCIVDYPPNKHKELRIITEDVEIDLDELKNRISCIDIRL